MTPVRDCNGQAVWRVRVSPNERTCLICGETFPASWDGCARCSADGDEREFDELGRPKYKSVPSVATIDYLMQGEWELIR